MKVLDGTGRDHRGFSNGFGATLAGLCTASAMVLAMAGAAMAQGYPERAVTLIVPFPAGGGTDITARIIADALSQEWGQTVVVDNRGGAAGLVGAEVASRAEPNGYTLFIGNVGTQSINPSLYDEIPYDPDTAFTPISLVAELPIVITVHPDFPAHTIEELVDLASENPGHYQYASSGTGNSTHLAGEVFARAAGIEMLHIPYQGGPQATTDLLGGRVDMQFDAVLSASSYVDNGSLRALAVTSSQRAPALPDVPTLAEAGVEGAESGSWIAVLGPAGMPEDIVDFISTTLQNIASTESFQQTLVNQGATAIGSTPEELQQVIDNDRARYEVIINDLGLTGDS